MKVTFLLGSGISIPAELPSVGKLTNAILSGNGRQYRPLHEDEDHEQARRIHVFLDWLKAQAARRYAEIPGRRVNYEDLAYLAGQISDDIAHEYENPALQPFVRNALIDLGALFHGGKHKGARKQLSELARATINDIRCRVGRLLSRPHKRQSYLQFFAKVRRDKSVKGVNIFTLNHDTLLENFLRSERIKVVDGLRDASNGDGSRRWDRSVFDDLGGKSVRIFKLHGSVDWFRWNLITSSWLQHKVSTENTDRDRCFIGTCNTTESFYSKVFEEEGPQLLAGTFNKVFSYNAGIFFELQNRFFHALQDPECKTLIICGYGFGDKGINTRIVEWRHRSLEHRLLIIDPAELSEIDRKARGAIRRELDDLFETKTKTERGPVKHLQMGVGRLPKDTKTEIVTWEEVKRRVTGTDKEFLA